jgi:hypothetical protein
VLEKVVTMHELKTCITIEEVCEINALLDMQNDMRIYQQEQQEKNIKK